jgi:hypothetical protein
MSPITSDNKPLPSIMGVGHPLLFSGRHEGLEAAIVFSHPIFLPNANQDLQKRLCILRNLLGS